MPGISSRQQLKSGVEADAGPRHRSSRSLTGATRTNQCRYLKSSRAWPDERLLQAAPPVQEVDGLVIFTPPAGAPKITTRKVKDLLTDFP
jgi:hypothetical protein